MLLLQHMQRHVRMQAQRDRLLLSFRGHTLHCPLNSAHDCLGGEYAPRSATHRARLCHALIMTLPHTLSCHLDQTEIAHRKRFGARAVASQALTQLLQYAIAIGLRFHVDEIAHDDSANVTQA